MEPPALPRPLVPCPVQVLQGQAPRVVPLVQQVVLVVGSRWLLVLQYLGVLHQASQVLPSRVQALSCLLPCPRMPSLPLILAAAR